MRRTADDRGIWRTLRKSARFEARVDANEERIEPNDWMPAAYRKTLTRQISQHAHSEIVGMLPEGNWITRAPTPAPQGGAAGEGAGRVRPRTLSLRRPPRTLGTSREELVDQMLSGKAKYSSDLQLSDADLGRYRRDRMAGGRRGDHEPDPAVPMFLRSLCARDDPRLQGRVVSSAPGLRDHGDAVAAAPPSRRRWRRARWIAGGGRC